MSEVLIRPGALVDPELLPPRTDRAKVALLTQPPVADLAEVVAARLRETGLAAQVRSLPDGEAAKTLEVANDTYRWLNQLGLSRYDTLVVIGGGAATDLGGFVGATYLRGVETVFCPTTLLGALDAAIGGKTGVNLEGKNLVGVFAQPARVVIDVEVMGRLSGELMREGFAEAVKSGLVGDIELVNLLEADGTRAPLEEVIRRAVAVKQTIVADDFREEGRRMILNYGHTVGHALEVATGLSHGAAVAVGMVAAGAIAEVALGFSEAERQRSLIGSLELPVAAPGDTHRGRVDELMGMDKKRDSTGLRMVLLEEFGKPVVVKVTDEAVTTGLAAIGVS